MLPDRRDLLQIACDVNLGEAARKGLRLTSHAVAIPWNFGELVYMECGSNVTGDLERGIVGARRN